jgi:hypothetical protein
MIKLKIVELALNNNHSLMADIFCLKIIQNWVKINIEVRVFLLQVMWHWGLTYWKHLIEMFVSALEEVDLWVIQVWIIISIGFPVFLS